MRKALSWMWLTLLLKLLLWQIQTIGQYLTCDMIKRLHENAALFKLMHLEILLMYEGFFVSLRADTRYMFFKN